MPTSVQSRAVYMKRPDTSGLYDERVDFFNPVIWLDELSAFYQDAGITPADAAGEVVGQWTDRSGNAFHANASGGNRPPLVSVGGVLLPDFDGTGHRLLITNNAAFADLEALTILMRVIVDTTGGGGEGYFWDYAGTSGYDMRFDSSLAALRLSVDGTSDATILTTEGVTAGVEAWLWATFDNAGDRKVRLWNPSPLAGSAIAMTGSLIPPAGDLYLATNSALDKKYDGRYRAFIVWPSVLTPQNMRWIMNGAG